MDFNTFSMGLMLVVSFIVVLIFLSTLLHLYILKYGVPEFDEDPEVPEEYSRPLILITVENHKDENEDILRAYDKFSSLFLAQGKTEDELMHNFKKRFPDHIGVVSETSKKMAGVAFDYADNYL
jgi:hypothetical protein